jgi:hypothetical protein
MLNIASRLIRRRSPECQLSAHRRQNDHAGVDAEHGQSVDPSQVIQNVDYLHIEKADDQHAGVDAEHGQPAVPSQVIQNVDYLHTEGR